MQGCGMDGMRDYQRAHIARTSGRSIWISASRETVSGSKRKVDCSGSGGQVVVVGAKGDSKGRLSGNGCLER